MGQTTSNIASSIYNYTTGESTNSDKKLSITPYIYTRRR